jgi:hypothetical protein
MRKRKEKSLHRDYWEEVHGFKRLNKTRDIHLGRLVLHLIIILFLNERLTTLGLLLFIIVFINLSEVH